MSIRPNVAEGYEVTSELPGRPPCTLVLINRHPGTPDKKQDKNILNKYIIIIK